MGALLPAVIGMLPTWLGPTRRSPQYQQNILAAWQPDPLWVSGVQSLFVFIAGKLKMNEARGASRWIRTAFLLAAASSAFGHIYVIGICMSSKKPNLSLSRMYVPLTLDDRTETTDILLRGPWLFLKFDFIIIAISCLSWAYAVLGRLLPENAASRGQLLMILVVGLLIIGPGATVSLGLFWREGKLQGQRKAAKSIKS